MNRSTFRCPLCSGALTWSPAAATCSECSHIYAIRDGIPDFFVVQDESGEIDDANKTWLDPEIVQARETAYRLSVRELQGMAFCMAEMGRRTFPGCRVLEACMGTGHFTHWLAEVAAPDTEIWAFDFSWPIIETAKHNAAGMRGVVLFRANARSQLPFAAESFDLILTRLSPFGRHGNSKTQAAIQWLKPGGWYFSAGWKRSVYETPPTEEAVQRGFESAQLHEWQYRRRQSAEEASATSLERQRLAARMGKTLDDSHQVWHSDGSVTDMTYEHLLMARKPE